VSDDHSNSSTPDLIKDRNFEVIRSGDTVTHCRERPGDGGHANTTDADDMNGSGTAKID
jgi:hypothetical protein